MPDRRVLISILGRAPKRDDGQYRTVTYTFPTGSSGAGTRSAPTAFSGWALLERLRPDAIVVLGTSGSMWPFLLLDALGGASPAQEQAFDALTGSAEGHCATQPQLDALAPLLERHLGVEISLRIVPAGRTQKEQLSLLTAVTPHIREGDKVTLDLTHGFRHQPILLLLAAIYLRTVRSVSIEKIYSSFFDEQTNEAELFDLAGLMRLIDWTSALAAYEKDGDLGVFEDPLSLDGAPSASLDHLRRSAFAERTHRYDIAFTETMAFTNLLREREMQGVGGIFQEYLLRQLARAEEKDPALRLLRRAQKHLRFGDYDRAAIVGTTAFLAAFAGPGENRVDDETLTRIKNEVESGRRPVGSLREPYDTMRNLRNIFAHMLSPRGNLREALREEESLRRKLGELLGALETHLSRP